jgi:hypothetical protein
MYIFLVFPGFRLGLLIYFKAKQKDEILMFATFQTFIKVLR